MSDPIRVVSLFAGIGGADLGLYWAADELGIDVEVVAAIDHWEPAVRVYNANHRHPVARVDDVKQMTRADLPPHDLVIGGPPCQNHSLAGPRDCHCHLGQKAHPNCCLADFLRLAGDAPFIMENVRSRLVKAPFSVKLCAANFGDVTTRERWFYSNYLLHVMDTPGPLRIRDIREAGADERAVWKKLKGQKNPSTDDGFLGSLTSGKGGVSGFLTMGPPLSSEPGERSEWLAQQKGKRWGLEARGDDDFIGSFGSGDWHGMQSGSALLKIAMRSASFRDTDRVLDEDGFLGSVVANSYRGSAQSKIEGCRNPTLLEMQRAHSFPDSWDWAGSTRTQRGKMIANSWPANMAKAVCKAMLQALIYEREQAA